MSMFFKKAIPLFLLLVTLTTNLASATNKEAKKPMQEVFEFLKQTGTYYLATVEGNQPRVRPFGTVNVFNNRLYIQSGKKKNVAKQIAANPKVEICAFDGKKWLRLAGELVADEDIEAQKSMLAAYPSLQKMYQPGDGNTVVYYVKNAKATFSSFGTADRTITF